MKYLICYHFEKLHRYVFDNYYFVYDDPRYKPLTFKDKIVLNIYHLLFAVVYTDFREYLKQWHIEHKSKYIRYNNYWRSKFYNAGKNRRYV